VNKILEREKIKHIERRKEQVEKEELIKIIKEKETIVGIDYYSSFMDFVVRNQ
jgi:hypothetical protein